VLPSPSQNWPVPIVLVTGFLGSGKTTLVNQILVASDWKNTLFLVNEFGERGIDDRLLPSQSGVHLLSNGCLCCAHADNCVPALRRVLADATERCLLIDRVVIETSGVAFPSETLHELVSDVRLMGVCYVSSVLTVVDASQFFSQIDRYPEVIDQIAAADTVFLTKTDLPSAPVDKLEAAVRQLNPICSIISSRLTFNLGLEHFGSRPNSMIGRPVGNARVGTPVSIHSRNLETFDLCVPLEVSVNCIAEFADALLFLKGEGILRAKGFLKMQEYPQWALVNIVKRTLYPIQFVDMCLTMSDSRLVFITEGVGRDLVHDFLKLALCEKRGAAGV
jgi:G3E family GTPase